MGCVVVLLCCYNRDKAIFKKKKSLNLDFWGLTVMFQHFDLSYRSVLVNEVIIHQEGKLNAVRSLIIDIL